MSVHGTWPRVIRSGPLEGRRITDQNEYMREYKKATRAQAETGAKTVRSNGTYQFSLVVTAGTAEVRLVGDPRDSMAVGAAYAALSAMVSNGSRR